MNEPRAESSILTHYDLMLRPDPSRTVIRPFAPGDPPAFANELPRAQRIADRILDLDEDEVRDQLALMTDTFGDRHRDVDVLLERRFADVAGEMAECGKASPEMKRLIGAYFSEEFSYEAAALFNPSVVKHRDQAGVAEGSVRFVMSLRGIGEGHVSSVTFRTGIWTPNGDLVVDKPSDTSVPPIIEDVEGEPDAIRLVCKESCHISETVLFPVAPSQRQGIEDVRLVHFTEEDGTTHNYGTYTAFSGSATRSELFEGVNMNTFTMRPMKGVVAESKGTALFPRRIGGKYTLLGRQDNESVWLLRSDDLYNWPDAAKLLSPRYPWEYVQMGNCGSPHELDEGWLVITHGVGVVRNYCVGACLLDKDDPSRVLARTPEPLLRPSPEERDGYVPNVVYSCGALVHDRMLLLPYGVADSFTAFAAAPIDKILAAME